MLALLKFDYNELQKYSPPPLSSFRCLQREIAFNKDFFQPFKIHHIYQLIYLENIFNCSVKS